MNGEMKACSLHGLQSVLLCYNCIYMWPYFSHLYRIGMQPVYRMCVLYLLCRRGDAHEYKDLI